jgi:hypothetical protein
MVEEVLKRKQQMKTFETVAPAVKPELPSRCPPGGDEWNYG